MAITTEKRMQKIETLKARLQKEEARLKEDQRKERTGQLIALGLLLQRYYADTTPENRKYFEQRAAQVFANDSRNLARVQAAFAKLRQAK